MKTTTILILISLFSLQINAQCKKFIQKSDMSSMLGYECEDVKVAEMYSGDDAVISQSIVPEKRYKIKILKEEYLGEYSLNIVDKEDNIISIEIKNETDHYWQVSTDKATDLELFLTIDDKKTANKLQRSGCVVVLVGSIENSELANANDAR